MKHIVVFGAGLVSRPLVRYLLAVPDYHLTIATRTVSKAHALLEGHPRGKAVPADVMDDKAVDALVRDCDLVVSLVPAPNNPRLSRPAIKYRKNLINTSYVSPEMKSLDEEARKAGVMLMCEIGLDPGIDHMSAVQVIDHVKALGGTVTHFSSCCGGIPAREANTNPWGYKFSWYPKGVILAGRNPARYRRNSEIVEIPGPELFGNVWPYLVEDEPGLFEIYPNRDSLGYESLYGIEGIPNMFRGTIRYPGWCETMKSVASLGLLDTDERDWAAGTSFADVATHRVPKGAGSVTDRVAGFLGKDRDCEVMSRLEWAGLLSDRPIGEKRVAPIDVFANRLQKLMAYKPGERDLVILRHVFQASYPDKRNQRIVAALVAAGTPWGDSAMAATVSLPAAVAAHLTLQGKLHIEGVQIPVMRQVYEPVLAELDRLGIRLKEYETTTMPGPFGY